MSGAAFACRLCGGPATYLFSKTVLGRYDAGYFQCSRCGLTQTEEPMARVALASGFSNAKQLSASFRQETGVTPTAYRRRSQGR